MAADCIVIAVPRETTLPTSGRMTFTTSADGQTRVEVRLVEPIPGEASDHRLLGRLELTGVLPAPKGVPQIELCFDIDTEGYLLVTATQSSGEKRLALKLDQLTGAREIVLQTVPRMHPGSSGQFSNAASPVEPSRTEPARVQ